MPTTVADHVVGVLKASGVQRVYGLPGDSLNGFTDAIRRDGRSPGSTSATRRRRRSRPPERLPSPAGCGITLAQAGGFALWMTRTVLSGRGDPLIELVKTNVRQLDREEV